MNKKGPEWPVFVILTHKNWLRNYLEGPSKSQIRLKLSCDFVWLLRYRNTKISSSVKNKIICSKIQSVRERRFLSEPSMQTPIGEMPGSKPSKEKKLGPQNGHRSGNENLGRLCNAPAEWSRVISELNKTSVPAFMSGRIYFNILSGFISDL